ncbi:MAG: hypothetical protein ACK4NZ_14820, partial [Tsuneonella sp.]
RILAMYDARPLDAPMPDEIDPDNVEAVEDAQLAAFEAGDDEWWLIGAPVTVAGEADRAPVVWAGASGGVHGGPV